MKAQVSPERKRAREEAEETNTSQTRFSSSETTTDLHAPFPPLPLLTQKQIRNGEGLLGPGERALRKAKGGKGGKGGVEAHRKQRRAFLS